MAIVYKDITPTYHTLPASDSIVVIPITVPTGTKRIQYTGLLTKSVRIDLHVVISSTAYPLDWMGQGGMVDVDNDFKFMTKIFNLGESYHSYTTYQITLKPYNYTAGNNFQRKAALIGVAADGYGSAKTRFQDRSISNPFSSIGINFDKMFEPETGDVIDEIPTHIWN